MSQSQVIDISSDEEIHANNQRHDLRTQLFRTQPQDEIIEISSDEELIFQTRTSRLSGAMSLPSTSAKPRCSTKITQRNQIKALRSEIEKLRREIEGLKSAENKVIEGRRDALKCGICTMFMTNPLSIGECGHSFCSVCLREWFKTCIDNALNHRVGVSSAWRNKDRLSPYQARGILAFLKRKHMPYNCPLCRSDVKCKPVSIVALRNMMEATSNAFGAPRVEEIGLEDSNSSVGYFIG